MIHIIGVMGSTGAGKTTAVKYMRELGAAVIDADIVSRELLSPEARLAEPLAELLGEEILLAPGIINRRAMGRVIFSDAQKRKAADAFIHPRVRSEMLRRAEIAVRIDGKRIVVLDTPLLIEAGMKSDVDDVWLITAPVETRIARLCMRDRLDEASIKARIAARVSDDELKNHADVVISNDGTPDELFCKVEQVFEERYGEIRKVTQDEYVF